jgi:hypothetical protein
MDTAIFLTLRWVEQRKSFWFIKRTQVIVQCLFSQYFFLEYTGTEIMKFEVDSMYYIWWIYTVYFRVLKR